MKTKDLALFILAVRPLSPAIFPSSHQMTPLTTELSSFVTLTCIFTCHIHQLHFLKCLFMFFCPCSCSRVCFPQCSWLPPSYHLSPSLVIPQFKYLPCTYLHLCVCMHLGPEIIQLWQCDPTTMDPDDSQCLSYMYLEMQPGMDCFFSLPL